MKHEKPAGLGETQRISQPAAAAARGVVRCSALARSAEGDEKPHGRLGNGKAERCTLSFAFQVGWQWAG